MNTVYNSGRAAGAASGTGGTGSSRRVRGVCMGFVTGLAMLIGVAARGADAEAPVAFYDAEQDRLSLDAGGNSFADVLAAVASAAGFKVSLNRRVEGDAPMALAFQELPLEQGLARLLEGKSFALERSGPKNRVSKVWVLSELAPSQARMAPGPTAPVPPSTEKMPTLPADSQLQIPQLTAEQLQRITDSLREYETRTGSDPRQQLEALRRLVAPDSPSFDTVPDNELGEALLKMMKEQANR